jgi:predicted membrane-bound spermidine synthase
LEVKNIQKLFFLSGFSALIYQIVWQKKLFIYFGINIEAISLIVSIFMLGLGIGSLIGGKIAEILKEKDILKIFITLEFLIGLLGITSLYLFSIPFDNQLQAIILSSIFLFVPIVFMGASFPILIQLFKNITPSKNISSLYFANTLGAGISSFLTIIWFYIFGVSNTIFVAILFNFIIVAIVIKEKRITI